MSERSPYKDGLPHHSVTQHQYNDRYTDPGYTDQDHRNADHQEYYDVQSERRYNGPASVNQLGPAAVPTQESSRIPDRVEEVWLKESRGRITFNDSDLMDVSRPTAIINLKRTVSAVFGIAAMLGLIGFLALSSAPDLTPEEIIAMRGYAGEQSTKTPFNLASLRDCDDITECAQKIDPQIGGNAPRASTTQTISTTTPPADADIMVSAVTTTETSNLSGYNELQEIPAATVPATIESVITEGTFSSGQSDQLTVLKQWSNVRSSPDVQSEILTSLAEGTTVTLLRQTGNWFEVSAYKRRQFIGYMHKSTLSEP